MCSLQASGPGRRVSLKVDYILHLTEAQFKSYTTCDIEFLWAYAPKDTQQFSVDRLDNSKGHCRGDVWQACLECNRTVLQHIKQEPHQAETEYQEAPGGAATGQSQVVVHPQSNRAQAHRAS